MSIPRAAIRTFHPFITEYFPIKLIGSFITADFKVGCKEQCSFCLSRRHPTRAGLFDEGVMIDNRMPPEKMAGLLRALPSYKLAGVQVRIGHDTDAGFEFEKSAQMIDRLDADHSITYLTRRPLSAGARDFFGNYRENLLLKLTASPRSASLRVTRDPMALIRTALEIDPRMVYWVVGPLTADNGREAHDILEALPAGSQVYLKDLTRGGISGMENVDLLSRTDYAALEHYAIARGLTVTEYFCSRGLGRLGQGFFDFDKIALDPDLARRERELSYCDPCPSKPVCHQEVDRDNLLEQLRDQLEFLGLTLIPESTIGPKPVEWLGPKTLNVRVMEPSSRGEETYLNHILNPRVSINLLSLLKRDSGVIGAEEAVRSHGGSFVFVSREVLSRWWLKDFFPVNDMNNIGESIMWAVERKLGFKFWEQFPVEAPPSLIPCRVKI